jgi:hypothetical protein
MNELSKWNTFCTEELGVLTPILAEHGFTLEKDQPHIGGERFLMQAVTTTSGRKLILNGRDSQGNRVVIKATSDKNGMAEIEHERTCRSVLTTIDFAAEVFHTPREVLHTKVAGRLINIQEYIEQECAFIDRPIEDQFTLAHRAFKAQEGVHATTYKHRRVIAPVFGIRDARAYHRSLTSFVTNILARQPDNDLVSDLEEARRIFECERLPVEQYTDFLTHTDFVPHNFRIHEGQIYLLDYSSLTFGNKYESWARFINFMELYNRPLRDALIAYVRDNRANEELSALRMMRIYRLTEIIWYYVQTLEKSTDNLLLLNEARVNFWHEVLQATLNDEAVPESTVATYARTRDTLRSEDEKRRQQGLH